MPFTKIAQMVLLHRTKGPPELQIRNIFKRHLVLNHWSSFKIISQNYSSWYPLPNCTNGSAQLKSRAARAPDRNIFKRHLLNHLSKFKIFSQNCSLWCLLSKFAQMVMLHRTKGCQSSRWEMSFNILMTFPEPLVQIQNNFTELFLIMPFTKIAQMGQLRWTKGPPELQTRNIFKLDFLLNHWPKFKITSQNCSSRCVLPKLHKWFCSTEQRGCQSSRLGMSFNDISSRTTCSKSK